MANISGIVKSTRQIMRQDVGMGSDEQRTLQLDILHQSFEKSDELLAKLRTELQP